MAKRKKKNRGPLSPATKVIRGVLAFFLVFVLYIGGSILYGTVTEYEPQERIVLGIIGGESPKAIDKSELSFMNWNVGYGGLGAESNFFYDDNRFFFSGGKMVRPSKDLSRKNVQGAAMFLKAHPTDFVLLQEVDSASTRSYFANQYLIFADLYPEYKHSFAPNFKVERVPLPMCEPWNVMGKMHSGLATYMGYAPESAQRLQFPGEFPWPSRIFNLDRCMLVHRFKTVKEGVELLVINTHNSAYDDGSLKKQEMDYLKQFIEAEYKKGNYVIVGGDWNQCPPGFHYAQLMPHSADTLDNVTASIARDFLPRNWTWAADTTVASNRKLVNAYEDGKTFVTILDFYLLSPNVELLEVKGHDLKFAYSDHQPIELKVRLKGLLPEPLDSLALPTVAAAGQGH